MADVIIAGNATGFGDGPIATFNFTTGGTAVGSFIPAGAPGTGTGSGNGRGLALTLDSFYYTELDGLFDGTDLIRICPYNGGAGGADTGSFPNPDPRVGSGGPRVGISNLAFGTAGLYVLAGYPLDAPQVWVLDPTTGAVLSGPIVLAGAAVDMDGFTVLPDGSFLGNLGDGSTTYTHWDSTGTNTGGDFTVPSATFSTGVDVSLDGLSLYFCTNTNGLTQTDLLGNFIASVGTGADLEDIALQKPLGGGGGEICAFAEDVDDAAPTPTTWPECDLIATRISVKAVSPTVSPGRSFTSLERVIQPDAGSWEIELQDIPINTRDDVLLWRQIESDLNGRSNTILVPVYEGKLSGTPIAATANANVAIGAVIIPILKMTGAAPQAGTHFSDLAGQMYRIKSIFAVSGSVYTAKVWPPVRKPITAGDALEFNKPVCRCRLASDDGMNVMLELLTFAKPSVRFLEDV